MMLQYMAKYPGCGVTMGPIPRPTTVDDTNSHYYHITTTHSSLEQTPIQQDNEASHHWCQWIGWETGR